MMRAPRPWVILAALLLAQNAAGGVVGLRIPRQSFFVAIRGVLPKGTTITGIRFYSNDLTTFPSVLLATDVSAARLPTAETVKRSVENVTGGPGYVTVAFPPYEVAESEHLWAIIRFPSNAVFRVSGMGGGPGIGWRDLPGLGDERSLFSVDGSMNEFTPAFDIMVLTGNTIPMQSQAMPAPVAPIGALTVLTDTDPSARVARFHLGLPRPGHVIIELYTIGGRHLLRLQDRDFSAGEHEVSWRGLDAQGKRVASGLYLYKVQVDAERRSGKLVFLN